MSMVKFEVDTTNKLFISKSGTTSFNVKKDLYSDAKEHWLSDGVAIGFEFPIRVVGGDPIGGGRFAGDLYFLRDGWKIRPQETNHTLLIDGNLFLDEGETGGILVPTLGGYTVLAVGERSSLVIGIETGGGNAPTAQEVADAVWDEAVTDHLGAGSTGEALWDAGGYPVVDDIADAVWDEAVASHQQDGSTGEALENAGAGGDPLVIADAVWDETRSGHVADGSFGQGVASVQGNITGSVNSVSNRVTANTDQIEGIGATDQIRDAILSDATRISGAKLVDANDLVLGNMVIQNNILNIYRPNGTLLARWYLYDQNGQPASTRVYQKMRV